MSEYIIIGTITGTHALKGEVKIYSMTDFSDIRFEKGNYVYIHKDNEYIKFKVKTHRMHKEYDLVSFENYDDINKILPFVKCDVYIKEDELHELDEDEFYYFELTECEVYHNQTLIGKVKNVVNYGASDILIINDEKNKEIMIPFVDEFIEEVDLEHKKIFINVIEGLLGETNED